MGDPHDNKLEEVVQFPRLLYEGCRRGVLQRCAKTFWEL